MSSNKNKITSEEFDREGELTVEQLRDIQEMQEQVLTRRTKKAKKNEEDHGEIIEIESDNESIKSAKKRKRDKKRKEKEQEITSTNVLKNILDPNIKSNDKELLHLQIADQQLLHIKHAEEIQKMNDLRFELLNEKNEVEKENDNLERELHNLRNQFNNLDIDFKSCKIKIEQLEKETKENKQIIEIKKKNNNELQNKIDYNQTVFNIILVFNNLLWIALIYFWFIKN